MSELKSCPCCSGDAYLRVPLRRHFKFYVVMCEECGLQTKEYVKAEDAIECWNNRAVDIDKVVELLKEKSYVEVCPFDRSREEYIKLEDAIEILKEVLE